MSLVLKDRVLETATSPGTGTVALLGASTGYQSFANSVGNANTTYYTIADIGGANWEVGIGTYYSGNNSVVRNTVLASSNAGNLTNFSSGTQSVFVTYPAEKSINLDTTGNVSALGNITSATWNATTVGVAYGGTGVTASSGANSVVLRDANQNTQLNNLFLNFTSTVSAGTTTTLTVASSYFQRLTGTQNQTFQLPDATTLVIGTTYLFDNDSTGNLTVNDASSGLVDVIPAGGYSTIFLESTSTVAGDWGRYASLPATVNWGTNTADLGGTTISNATWQGSTVATGYGGTGLTSFTSGGAVYATSTSALTTGTLPVTAGGTGVASLTTGYIPFGANTSALNSSSNLTYLSNTLSAPVHTASGAITGNVAYGVFNNGNLGYSDTGLLGSFVSSQNSYGQFVIQNTSSGNAAVANYIVNNNLGNATAYRGSFGINSSTFAGSGSFNLPSSVHLSAANGELVLGTTTNNGVRIVTNNSNVDAITINSSNAVAFSGSYGANTYLLQSTGNASAPIWQSPANITAGAVTSLLTFTNAGNGAASGVSFNGSAAQTISSNTLLPSQSGNSGKYLTTDGANALSWSTVNAALAAGNNSILINNVNVTANANVAAGQNGFSVGPITTANGVSVTIASGQKWVII